jgi:polyhydroxyalkanoate synthesis regulator phasin
MKRLLMIAAAVAVIALAAVAVGGAATSAQEGDGPIGTFLSKVADKLGVTEDELKTAIDEARTETIDEAVAEGLLTEEQGERLQEGIFPFRGRFSHEPRHAHVMDAAAEVLGLERDELMEQLRDGNSLAELAEAQGKDLEAFKAALLDKIEARLGELVAEGDLTQEQADEIFQCIEENIDSIVNAERCRGGFGGPRFGPGGFGEPWFGPGGFGEMWFGPLFDDEAESTETSDVTA